jgi:hypothetical protein
VIEEMPEVRGESPPDVVLWPAHPPAAAPARVPLKELTIDTRRTKPSVVKEVEQRLGESLSRKGREADLVWAWAYAVGRRIDPDLTWEEAGDLDVTFITEVDVPPTSAGD